MKAFCKFCVVFCSFFSLFLRTAFSDQAPYKGALSILSYNVAGIHNVLSPLKNRKNMRTIGEKINQFDIALLQENFSYHSLLMEAVGFPFWKKGDFKGVLGSGLMRLSKTPFNDFESFTWPTCSGVLRNDSDCLAKKGFTFSRHEVTPGVFIDIYNIHADAGRSINDKKARFKQFKFLSETIEEKSKNSAVIVAGDWNLLHDDEDDQLVFYLFLKRNNLSYMCKDLICGQEKQGVFDRFTFRGGKEVSLKLKELALPYEFDFYDKKENPLSDHDPLVIEIEWSLN